MNTETWGPPVQSTIPAIEGSPEGGYDGPKGSLIVDKTNAALYIKTTDEGTLTGWQNVSQPTSVRFVADNDVEVQEIVTYDADTNSYSSSFVPTA